jgi:hypothetical protein
MIGPLWGAMQAMGMAQGVAALAVPVPIVGPAELIVNGDFTAWTGDNPDGWTLGWTEDASNYVTEVAGTCRVVGNGTLANGVRQSICTAKKWYVIVITLVSRASGSLKLSEAAVVDFRTSITSPGTYTTVYRSASGNALAFGRGTGACDFVIDNVSTMELALSSLFSTASYGTTQTTKAACTIVAGTRAGVVCNLDSAGTPANFVIASHDGTTARLEKCVAGTYTSLIATTVAYSAGAYVEVRRLAGTDNWQLWYNDSQVGTNQAISDAAIKAATLAGYFNTYAANTVANFSCVAS